MVYPNFAYMCTRWTVILSHSSLLSYTVFYKGNVLKQVKKEFSYEIYFTEWSYSKSKVVWFFLDFYKIYIKLGPTLFGKHMYEDDSV